MFFLSYTTWNHQHTRLTPLRHHQSAFLRWISIIFNLFVTMLCGKRRLFELNKCSTINHISSFCSKQSLRVKVTLTISHIFISLALVGGYERNERFMGFFLNLSSLSLCERGLMWIDCASCDNSVRFVPGTLSSVHHQLRHGRRMNKARQIRADHVKLNHGLMKSQTVEHVCEGIESAKRINQHITQRNLLEWWWYHYCGNSRQKAGVLCCERTSQSRHFRNEL